MTETTSPPLQQPIEETQSTSTGEQLQLILVILQLSQLIMPYMFADMIDSHSMQI